MTSQINMTPMQEFNELVERADKDTYFAYDRCDLDQLVTALRIDGMPRFADEIKRLAIELGLWRHNSKGK